MRGLGPSSFLRIADCNNWCDECSFIGHIETPLADRKTSHLSATFCQTTLKVLLLIQELKGFQQKRFEWKFRERPAYRMTV
jgi:hypothetical protein